MGIVSKAVEFLWDFYGGWVFFQENFGMEGIFFYIRVVANLTQSKQKELHMKVRFQGVTVFKVNAATTKQATPPIDSRYR